MLFQIRWLCQKPADLDIQCFQKKKKKKKEDKSGFYKLKYPTQSMVNSTDMLMNFANSFGPRSGPTKCL